MNGYGEIRIDGGYHGGSHRDSSYAEFYSPGIEDIHSLIIPTLCILGVFKRVLQQRGGDAALQAAAIMHQGHVVDLSAGIALKAAKMGSKLRLPLADSVILATTLSPMELLVGPRAPISRALRAGLLIGLLRPQAKNTYPCHPDRLGF